MADNSHDGSISCPNFSEFGNSRVPQMVKADVDPCLLANSDPFLNAGEEPQSKPNPHSK